MTTFKKGPAVKVTERPTYDACHALFLTGHIHNWWIDKETSNWAIDNIEDMTRSEAAEAVRRITSTLTSEELAKVLDTLGQVMHTPSGTGRLEAGPVDYTERIAKAAAVLTANVGKPIQPKAPAPKRALVSVAAPSVAIPRPASSQPAAVTEWLERLIYAPKREYAEAWANYKLSGCAGDEPIDPCTDWAVKVRVRVDRLVVA